MISNKKNALIIAYNDLNNSGVPNLIYQVINAMHSEYNFDIIVFGNNNYYYDLLLEKGISNVNLIKLDLKPPKNRLIRIIWTLFFKGNCYYKKTLSIVSQKNYDVVHSFKEFDSWPFLKACSKENIKKRILHSSVIYKRINNPFLNIINKVNLNKSIKYSTDLVAVSKHCAKSSFKNKKYTVLYNGYDEERFNIKVKNKLPDDEIVLTHVATYNTNKNQLFSLEVINELRQIYKKSKLKLIGKETEIGYLERLNLYIAKNNLEKNVEIINGADGIKDNFEYTTFTILPSIKEGAGIVAIESQASGIKVFASTGVSKEMDAGGAIFIDLKDGAKKWAETILKMFEGCGNKRSQFHLEPFSHISFKKTVETIYKKNN